MFLVCAAIFFGVLLGLAWAFDRLVDGVEHHVDEHTNSSPSSAASWPRSATADDVTADMWPARSPIIGT